MSVLETQIGAIDRLQSRAIVGSISAVRGLSLLVDDLPLPVGSLVRIAQADSGSPQRSPDRLRGEVVGFDGTRSIVMLLGQGAGLSPGAEVVAEPDAGPATVQVGASLLGRVIDGLGQTIDGGRKPIDTVARPLLASPTAALRRRRIGDPLPTGVRSIDAMLTLGKGQRVGIFSGAGVGKSTLIGTIARNTSADVNVIALVGERGREVRDFIEVALGERGLARSVVVVATGDQSPLLRVRAGMVACAVAEFFRDRGADVMLMMDSITRFAQAQRQIGLTIGEQPATKGYTPSVFALLPVLLERAGAVEGGGSITGLYAVLVEGDDMNEPISDAARGVLDGHIVLSRRLATRGHYPAVNVLESISRVAEDVCDQHHIAARRHILKLLAAHAEIEELVNIDAYVRGSSPICDVAIDMKPRIDSFLQQERTELSEYPHTCRKLLELSAAAHETAQRLAKARTAPAPMPDRKR
jgi:flagellum-specific ATP synthase